MKKTTLKESEDLFRPIIKSNQERRSPVHVVYGGADRFSAATVQKLGSLALDSLRKYAPTFVEFAQAMHLPGWETLPHFPEAIVQLEKQIAQSRLKARAEDFNSWFTWTVYQKTVAKLENEPIEDFRIDFEDGYGFRTDEEEDRDAVRAAQQLATAHRKGTISPICGFRIKSLNPETRKRALRTLDLFLSSLIEKTENSLPANFVVTLPKITDRKQVAELCDRLKKFEKKRKLTPYSIGIELMIESPVAIFDRKGGSPLKAFVNAAKSRCTSAHFGAYDYTSALGITAVDQHLNHPACELARQVMLANLSPLGLRLSDSVTTELPVAIHKRGRLSKLRIEENRRSVHHGWQLHFRNITGSMCSGFFQSWDLHPNQLPARYAAVYAFYLLNREIMAERLKQILSKSTQAVMTGNEFDDVASARGLVNFFVRGIECGAFSSDDVKDTIGMGIDELNCVFPFVG